MCKILEIRTKIHAKVHRNVWMQILNSSVWLSEKSKHKFEFGCISETRSLLGKYLMIWRLLQIWVLFSFLLKLVSNIIPCWIIHGYLVLIWLAYWPRGRVFANVSGDWGSISGRVILKTKKMVLDASLLNSVL